MKKRLLSLLLCLVMVFSLLPFGASAQVYPITDESVVVEIRFHDTRHSSGSALCQMGVSMKEIQEWLGHSDFSTTANIYSHLTSDTKVRTAESMMKTLGMTENKESA